MKNIGRLAVLVLASALSACVPSANLRYASITATAQAASAASKSLAASRSPHVAHRCSAVIAPAGRLGGANTQEGPPG